MGMDSDTYFQDTPPPANLKEVSSKVQAFVDYWKEREKPIVLVSSGGTTVPLENQTVRFLDNFSAGTRGAASAEKFLEAGYAVIFLHRQFSLQPYSRHYTHSKNCFLDYMTLTPQGGIQVDEQWSKSMSEVLVKYQNAKKNNTLLMIDFVTVRDYLFMLKQVTQLLAPLGKRAMFYLAAAVSDFFLPPSKMVEHKIQSDGGPLSLHLDRVPKILKPLVKEWAPLGFVISFKLETDPSILIAKALRSLSTYGHHIVIGNILNTRKKEVVFVLPNQQEPIYIRLSEEEMQHQVEIESIIIPKLIERHVKYMN